MSEIQPRVLSIQSHVVSGYVGNKSATFPLQLLGFEVDAINSVQLSNHTGYKVFKGQVLAGEDLVTLVDGLAENDLDNYTHLLTGYIGSASFLNQIIQIVKRLKEKNPKLIYVCDPVMGDNGKMYVPQELKDIYRSKIVPLADVITPNHFELELLTGKVVSSMTEMKSVIQELHGRGPMVVAISSTEINDKLTSIISTKHGKMDFIEIPRIPALYTGSGDLFAALLLAYFHIENDCAIVLEKTLNTVYQVLLKTFEYSKTYNEDNIQRARKIELKLVQSKKIIENPPINLKVQEF